MRRKIQNQLEIESFKKAKLEEALSTLSYKTFLQVKDLGDNESNDKENFAWVSNFDNFYSIVRTQSYLKQVKCHINWQKNYTFFIVQHSSLAEDKQQKDIYGEDY